MEPPPPRLNVFASDWTAFVPYVVTPTAQACKELQNRLLTNYTTVVARVSAPWTPCDVHTSEAAYRTAAGECHGCQFERLYQCLACDNYYGVNCECNDHKYLFSNTQLWFTGFCASCSKGTPLLLSRLCFSPPLSFLQAGVDFSRPQDYIYMRDDKAQAAKWKELQAGFDATRRRARHILQRKKTPKSGTCHMACLRQPQTYPRLKGWPCGECYDYSLCTLCGHHDAANNKDFTCLRHPVRGWSNHQKVVARKQQEEKKNDDHGRHVLVISGGRLVRRISIPAGAPAQVAGAVPQATGRAHVGAADQRIRQRILELDRHDLLAGDAARPGNIGGLGAADGAKQQGDRLAQSSDRLPMERDG